MSGYGRDAGWLWLSARRLRGGSSCSEASSTRSIVEEDKEALVDPRALHGWLIEAGLADEDLSVRPADLRRAIEVREALRAVLLAHNGGTPADDGAATTIDAAATLDAAAKRSRVRLRFDAECGPWLEPDAGGIDGALGRLLAISRRHAAMAEGTWSRLKACRERGCEWGRSTTRRATTRGPGATCRSAATGRKRGPTVIASTAPEPLNTSEATNPAWRVRMGADMPSFCRHNRLIQNCPICSRQEDVELNPNSCLERSPDEPAANPVVGTRAHGSGSRGRHTDAAEAAGAVSGCDACSAAPRMVITPGLAPGLRSSADAQRLAEAGAFAADSPASARGELRRVSTRRSPTRVENQRSGCGWRS